jgi:hypothetical protein
MGLLDWVFKYKFDNEKQTLIDLRTHTIDWYNQVTEPLKPVLKEIRFQEPVKDAEQYGNIARDIYEMKITSNAGENLWNVLDSMGNRGIPFFTSREELRERAKLFEARGHIVKELAMNLWDWKSKSLEDREKARKHLVAGWEEFEKAKDELVTEINHQIRNLG